MSRAAEGSADLVLTGGDVYTVDAARRWAGAVAVKGGRIAAVGEAGAVAGLVGPGTEVMELAGRMVLPAFQDAHVHPIHGGLARMRCYLHEAAGAGEALQIIRDYSLGHPAVPWITGGGWAMDWFPHGTPSRHDLDRAVPDRPAYLVNADYHGAWVNSKALELAGITRDTPDPADGRIERDPDGEPGGTLHEGAMDLVERLVPAITEAEREQALRSAERHLHSLGITAWQDAMVGPDELAAYRRLAETGELRSKAVLSLLWDRHRGDDQIEELAQMRDAGTFGPLRLHTVKLFLDGVAENFTASMLEPYLDADGRATSNRGIDMIEPHALKTYASRLVAAGFQLHFHAIGDRAVRNGLDAVAFARAEHGPSDARHHIAHIQVVHPDDLARFRSLGVVANAQPFWACEEGYMRDLTIPFLGPVRSRTQYPFGSLLRRGAMLAFGSDWPVSTPNPLLQIEVAVTRTSPRERGASSFLPEERLDLPSALAAFTMGSAYVNKLDAHSGSIEPGKSADLVVLDRNLFGPDAGPPGDARVLLTLLGGEPVYAHAEAGTLVG